MSPTRGFRRPRASTGSIWSTMGGRAAAYWLESQKIPHPDGRWAIEISLDIRNVPAPAEFDERVDTRFHLDLYAEEWGILFCHASRLSRVRVTDIPFVHGRDDYKLLDALPDVTHIGDFLRGLEAEHDIAFRRDHALIYTDLEGALPAIRRWVAAL